MIRSSIFSLIRSTRYNQAYDTLCARLHQLIGNRMQRGSGGKHVVYHSNGFTTQTMSAGIPIRLEFRACVAVQGFLADTVMPSVRHNRPVTQTKSTGKLAGDFCSGSEPASAQRQTTRRDRQIDCNPAQKLGSLWPHGSRKSLSHGPRMLKALRILELKDQLINRWLVFKRRYHACECWLQ